jgi:prepilin signal peptidase PulO-like enzyme (type II secretory pathway)
VADALSSGQGELLGGLWVLLVSVAALRTGGLPKALNWLGILIGFAGIVSVVPPLLDAAYVFGLLQIVWLIWMGIVMLRTRAPERSQRQPVSPR